MQMQMHGFKIRQNPNGLFSVSLSDTLGGRYKVNKLTFNQAGDWVWNMADNHEQGNEVCEKMCKVFNQQSI